MNVNGIGVIAAANSTKDAEKTAKSEAVNKDAVKKEAVKDTAGEAAVYEKGNGQKAAGRNGVVRMDTTVIERMKAEVEEKTASLRSLVEKMMLKQGQTIQSATDYLMALKNGTLEIDDQTRAQAQKDIAEDGYWGVEQTSDRLVSFAKALAGDNPELADKMMKAIEKGFEEATKTWGDKLPDLCQKTLEATREKMNNWKNGISNAAAAESVTE